MREERARITYHVGMRALPVHPYRPVADRQIRTGIIAGVAGGCIASAGIFSGVGALVPMGGAAALLGAALAYLAAYGRNQCEALVARGIAIDLGERGEHDEAEALLASVRTGNTAVWRTITVQRAHLSLERAEPAEAEARATAALERPIRGFSRDAQEMQNAYALALRAMARAALGKDAEALADAAAARASDAAMPEVIALAAVAEQVVCSRSGDLAALAAALESARPLFDATAPRERALVRAFRRLVAAKQTSAYREPGRVDDVPRSRPELDTWVARIAPGAAAFLPETSRRARTTQPDVTQPPSTPVAAGSAAIAREPARRPRLLALRIAIAILCALIAYMTWQTASGPPSEDSYSLVTGCVGAVILVALFYGMIASAMRKDEIGRRAVLRARRTLASGDAETAERLFAGLARSPLASVAAEAHLELAVLAQRRTDLRAALEHCDAGLAVLAKSPSGAAHADILLPRLVSERAFALAGLGRIQQADAELAAIASTYPSYAHLTGAIFRTRLLSALRSMSVSAATEIARERTPQLALSLHDETMADAVLALESNHPRELARLHEELADPGLARWLDYMVPGAREQIAARAS